MSTTTNNANAIAIAAVAAFRQAEIGEARGPNGPRWKSTQ